MQLTTVSPSLQFSQKHQGNVSNPQHSPSQLTLQPEAPVFFGEISKPKKWTLAALVFSGLLYASNALFSPTAVVAEPPQKIETLVNNQETSKEGLGLKEGEFNVHIEVGPIPGKLKFFLTLILLGMVIRIIQKTALQVAPHIPILTKWNTEEVFKALEEDPKLMEQFNKILAPLPDSIPTDPGQIGEPENKTLILKNMIRTALAIEDLLTKEQKEVFRIQNTEIIDQKTSPAEAMNIYKEALGPKFNWKPVEKLITAFMENPTGQ